MSRSYQQYPAVSVYPPIVVTDNDVLSGRGVNIACHPGNERFRTLVYSRADDSYCTSYSASEKRAVAEEIIRHIQSLDPPGRFLKREGRGRVSRGLNGPWEILTDREAIKKTCQALRDCNRMDRIGYANGVQAPQDVVQNAEKRNSSGLSGRQHAQAAAAASAAAAAAAASASLKRTREQMLNSGTAPPSAVAAVTATLNNTSAAAALIHPTGIPLHSGAHVASGATAPLTTAAAAIAAAGDMDVKRPKIEESTNQGMTHDFAHDNPVAADVSLTLGTDGMLDDTPLSPPAPSPTMATLHHHNGVPSIISEPSPASSWAPDPVAETTSPGDAFITASVPPSIQHHLDSVVPQSHKDEDDAVAAAAAEMANGDSLSIEEL